MNQAVPGQQLTGHVGLWVNGVLGYAYQLTRNGVVFQAGNWIADSLYTVQPSDVGSVIALLVIATNRSGAGPIISSAPILIVAGSSVVPQLFINMDMSVGTIPIIT
jgi:hypothetical protein